MRILFGTPYLPVPPDFGGARRIYELIRGTREHNDVQTVSLVGPHDDVTAAEERIGPIAPIPVPFTARCAGTRERRVLQLRSLMSIRSSQSLLYHHPAFQAELDSATRSGSIDLVQLEFSQMGSYVVHAAIPTVLDVHNVEHDLLRQMATGGSTVRRLFNLAEYRKLRLEETAAWKRATCCIATSADDARMIEQEIGRPVHVIPNGVDAGFFTPGEESSSEPGLIVFTGAMRYRPNADGVRFFTGEIFPIVRREVPQARVAIVGADPTSDVLALSKVPGVLVTGTVADVRPWLERAQVVIVPLRTGGGTRLKILEAFASGRPVVSTTIGAAGIDVTHDWHLLLADDVEEFARSVIALLNDQGLRRRLAGNALELVRERYQWSAIAATLADLHARLVSEADGRSDA